MLPADDEQNEAAPRRQRCQDGEDRRDEDAEAEDELPSVALRQHSARELSADVSPKEGAQNGALLLRIPIERTVLTRAAVIGWTWKVERKLKFLQTMNII